MEGLVLKSGGKLEQVRWIYDDVAKKGEYVPFDVSDRALEFLFEPVRFEGDIRLRDVFLVVKQNPVLLTVFRRDWATELLEEALATPVKPYTGEYDPDGIEYLELYRMWNFNSKTQEYSGISRLDFHGIGYVLKEDIKQDDWVMHPAGTRIQWGIDFSPLGELMDLPLRVDSEVVVCEDDVDGGNWGNRVQVAQCNEHTLGQVVHGVFWELSFYGAPESRNAQREELQATVAEVREAFDKDEVTIVNDGNNS